MHSSSDPGIVSYSARYLKQKDREELLQQIAQQTDGRYFRAENNSKLREIYDEIDQLEKSKIDVQEFKRKHEMFLPFAILAVGLLIIEILLRYLYFRKLR